MPDGYVLVRVMIERDTQHSKRAGPHLFRHEHLGSHDARVYERRRTVGGGSVASYLELWHRSDQRSREHVGSMMRDVSGYMTIPAPPVVRRREVREFVSRFIGSSTRRTTGAEFVGYGANHAFDSLNGRFRFVESLASFDGSQKEGPKVSPPENWNSLNRSGPSWEWLQLVGSQQFLESPGVDRTPEHHTEPPSCKASLNCVNYSRVRSRSSVCLHLGTTPILETSRSYSYLGPA